ncbi:MAG TPA: hypothetical protein VGJ44_21885 [Kribbellaceae bacterium]|jgi:hypothetical protein
MSRIVIPARFLPPPEPHRRPDGSRHHVGVTYAVAFGTAAGVPARLVTVPGANHIFDGHDDIDALVDLSVGYLAAALARTMAG